MINKIFAFIYRNLDKIILITAILLSIGSFIYYYDQGLITAYGDSKGHLNIARRVVDSLTPGAAQLGGYWLPLLHILMLPTIGNDFLWNSGISGSIPNMISFVIAVYFIYRFGFELTKSKLSGLIATAVVGLNLNLIYMQTTPMTESLFIATITVGVYYFYRWIKYEHIPDGLIAAFFVLLSSLNRYEGWALTIGCVSLLVYNWVINKFNKKQEGKIILFSSLACIGIFIWLLWGAVIFKDPLEFMHNDLSAGRQIEATYTAVKPLGEGDVLQSVLINILSIKHTSGLILLLIFIISLVTYFIRKNIKIFRLENIFPFVLLTPFLFDVFTVYVGNVPIEVPELSKIPPPGDYFNIRYSLYSLPAIAIFIAIISKKRIIQALILLIVIVNYLFQFNFYTNFTKIVTLRDAGVLAATYDKQGLMWLKQNYDAGLILASMGSLDGFMFDTGIKQKNFIVEGAYKIWEESLTDPTKHAKWIIVSSGNDRDRLYKKLNFSVVNENYNVAYKNGGFTIYKSKI